MMDRLYQVYATFIERLRADVLDTNRRLGSPHPECVKLSRISPAEFAALMSLSQDDPELHELWLRRIIRGHEQDSPELTAALANCRKSAG